MHTWSHYFKLQIHIYWFWEIFIYCNLRHLWNFCISIFFQVNIEFQNLSRFVDNTKNGENVIPFQPWKSESKMLLTSASVITNISLSHALCPTSSPGPSSRRFFYKWRLVGSDEWFFKASCCCRPKRGVRQESEKGRGIKLPSFNSRSLFPSPPFTPSMQWSSLLTWD